MPDPIEDITPYSLGPAAGWGNAYFGESDGAPVYEALPQVGTPVGTLCLDCDEPIAEGERGFVRPFFREEGAVLTATHWECSLRHTVGSVKHQRGECGCATGEWGDDDAEYPSKRVAARFAVNEFERANGLPETAWH